MNLYTSRIHNHLNDFMLLDIPNLLPVKHEEPESLLLCQTRVKLAVRPWFVLFLSGILHPFLGILDDLVEKKGKIPYKDYALNLPEAGKRAGEYKYIFDALSSLCGVQSRFVIFLSGIKKARGNFLRVFFGLQNQS